MAILARRALWWVFAVTAFLGAILAIPQQPDCLAAPARPPCRATSPDLAAGLVLLGIASVALASALALRGSARQGEGWARSERARARKSRPTTR